MADLKNFVSDTATSFLNEFFAPLKDDNGVALPSRYEVMFFVPTGVKNMSEGSMILSNEEEGGDDIENANGLNIGHNGKPPGANYPQ